MSYLLFPYACISMRFLMPPDSETSIWYCIVQSVPSVHYPLSPKPMPQPCSLADLLYTSSSIIRPRTFVVLAQFVLLMAINALDEILSRRGLLRM